MGLCEQGQQVEYTSRGACAATGHHTGSDVDGTSTPDAKDAPAKCFNSDDEAPVDSTVLSSMGIRRHSGPEAYSWQGPVPTVPSMCCTLPGNSSKQPLLQHFQQKHSQQQLLYTGKRSGPYSTATSNHPSDRPQPPQRPQSSAPNSRQQLAPVDQGRGMQHMGDLVSQSHSQVNSNRTSRPSRADQPPLFQPNRASPLGVLSPTAQSRDVPHSSTGPQGQRQFAPVKQQQQPQEQQVVEHFRDQNPRSTGSWSSDNSSNTGFRVGNRDSDRAGGLQPLCQPDRLPVVKAMPAEANLGSSNRGIRHSSNGNGNRGNQSSGPRGSKAGQPIAGSRPQPLLLPDDDDVLYNVASPTATAVQPQQPSRTAGVSQRQQQQPMHPMQVLRAAGAHISSSLSSDSSGEVNNAPVPATSAGQKQLHTLVQGKLASAGQQTQGRFTGTMGAKPPAPGSTSSTPTAAAAAVKQPSVPSWDAPSPAPPPPPPPPPRRQQQIVLVPSQDIRKAPGTLVPLTAGSTSSKHLQGNAATAAPAGAPAASGGRTGSGVTSPPAAPPTGPPMRVAPPAPPAGHPPGPVPAGPAFNSRDAGREAGRNLLQQLQQPHKQQKQSSKQANGSQEQQQPKQQGGMNQGGAVGAEYRQSGSGPGQGALSVSPAQQGPLLAPYSGPAAGSHSGPSSNGSASSASNRSRSVSSAGGGGADRSLHGPLGMSSISRSPSGLPSPVVSSPPAPPGVSSSRGTGSNGRGPAIGRPDVAGNGNTLGNAAAAAGSKGRVKGQNGGPSPAAVALNSLPPGTVASAAPAGMRQHTVAANLAPAGPSDEYTGESHPGFHVAGQHRPPVGSKGTAAMARVGGARSAESQNGKQRQGGYNASGAAKGKENALRIGTANAPSEPTAEAVSVKAAGATGLAMHGAAAATSCKAAKAVAAPVPASPGAEEASETAASAPPKANPAVIASCLPEDEDDLLGITPSISAKTAAQQQQSPNVSAADAGQNSGSFIQQQQGVMGGQPPPPPRKLTGVDSAAGRGFVSSGDAMGKLSSNGSVSTRPGQLSPFGNSMSPPLPQAGHHMVMSPNGMPQVWVPYAANAVGPAAAGAPNGHPLGVSGPSGLIGMRQSMESPGPIMPGVMLANLHSPQMHHLAPQQYGSAAPVLVKPVPSKRLEIVDPRRKDSSRQLDNGVSSNGRNGQGGQPSGTADAALTSGLLQV